jgi:hypothetical protein
MQGSSASVKISITENPSRASNYVQLATVNIAAILSCSHYGIWDILSNQLWLFSVQ